MDTFNLDSQLDYLVKKGRNLSHSLRRTRMLINDWVYNERLKSRYLYFITFTFVKEYDNSNFSNWNRKEFTNYLRRDKFAKHFNFILYADFGELNGRFHLHGLVSGDFLLDSNVDYFNKFGFTHIDLLRYDSAVNYVVKYSTKFTDNFNFRILRLNNI